jgi:glycosyltransferase involved in cell wall biosynthesis
MSNIMLIIPAFNEAANIELVVDELTEKYPDLDYVIINDGSTDDTSAICHRRGYHIIDHPENMGLAAAFHTGMKFAYDHGYECAVQFDGDGQHRAEFVNAMYDKLKEGYDIVIASRFIDKKKPISMRMLGSNMIQLAIRLKTGADIKDPTSGMRMYGRRLLEEFSRDASYVPEPSTIALLIKRGAKVAEVPAVMNERQGGESYLKPAVAVKYMYKVMKGIIFGKH